MKSYKIIIVVAILLIIGGVGYFFISKYNNTISQSTLKNAEKYDGNKTTINLDNLTYNGTGLSIENNTIYIVYGGSYELSGTTKANIVIETIDNEDVYLIFNGVNIKADEPIYIKQGDVTIVLNDGSKNYIEATKVYNETDEVDSAIYSKDDLTFTGNGTLELVSTYNGITSKDTLTIESGTYNITATNNGIKGKDSVTINNGSFNIEVDNDGIHSDGDIIISDGTFEIKSSDDGIHADGLLQIDGGTLNIEAAEGLEATYVKINDGTINISATDDGINAANKSDNYSVLVEINGGTINITMGQGDTDGVDSNGDIIINGGTISVTGQSTFDYDGTGKINGGTVICNGEKVTALPNQFMGGGGTGMMPGGQNGMIPGNMPQDGMQNMQRRR